MPGVVSIVVFDALIFLVSNGSTGDRSDRTTNQCAGGFVVPFVTNRGANGGSGETTQQRPASAKPPILAACIYRNKGDKKDKNGNSR